MSTKELTNTIKELKELKAMQDELNQEISDIEDQLKKEMEARSTEEMKVDVFTLRYKTVKSNRFDSKAFKATYQDLYDQYTKENIYKRFTIA
jgi:predicted phage-related endonuclease